jgi:hypothetical protein
MDTNNAKLRLKVIPLLSRTGKPVTNQYVITDGQGTTYFQSYKAIIAVVSPNLDKSSSRRFQIVLDKYYWDYSATTIRYRNRFLNETTAETRAKIKSGEYTLASLNDTWLGTDTWL